MEGKEIELRSEEVQEVMGQIPAWIVRWGITILFIVVLALLVGSYFFRYPDVITTEMTLTSRHPVAEVVARSSGKINELYVFNGQEVKMGAPLAVVENPARTEDVFRLEAGRLGLTTCYVDAEDRIVSSKEDTFLILGIPESRRLFLLSQKDLFFSAVKNMHP